MYGESFRSIVYRGFRRVHGSEINRSAADAAHQLRVRRTDKGDGFAFVPPVDAEIFAIHRDDAVAGVKLAHADEAKVS